MCRKVGLVGHVVSLYAIRSLEVELEGHDSRAKEILVLCRKPVSDAESVAAGI
jgi:hypothetical protein